MTASAISFDRVGFRYAGRVAVSGLKQALFDLARRRRGARCEPRWALRELSFTIAKGESVGIIGRNGSGKSTTLALIAGILSPTVGRVAVDGFTVPLLQLGAGFSEELTGSENAVLNAVLLGFTRREAVALLPKIRDFSGLEERMDDPIRTYSTGMKARLGFSVAAHVEPEIILIDEILAVGDDGFRVRCQEALQGLNGAGTTLVYVGHAKAAVHSLCERCILLHDGGKVYEGDTATTFTEYHRLLNLSLTAAKAT